MTLNFLSNFRFYFDRAEGIFYTSKINSRCVYVIKTKTWSEGFSKSKNRRCSTVTSHVHSSESNNPNTFNSDNVVENSKLPHINVHSKRSLNELVTF